MAITLDKLDSACQSISIKSSTGDELLIDGSGHITANINGTVETVPGGFSDYLVSQESATAVESELVSAPLAGRIKVVIQNLGPNDVYISNATGVAVTDLCIPCGASWDESLDDGANIFAICAATETADLRVAEFKA